MIKPLSTWMCFLLIFFMLTACPSPTFTRGVNGGIECAACTIVVGIFGQIAEINNASIQNVAFEFCDNFHKPLNLYCKRGIRALEPVLNVLIDTRLITPDSFCYGLNFCHQDVGQKVCNLFPVPATSSFNASQLFIKEKARKFHKKYFKYSDPSKAYRICDLPGVKEICAFIETNFNNMRPAVDVDGDGFSASEFWRGAHWRGKDCSDFDSSAYPGRQPENADINSDKNCNGIWGIDWKTGVPWETKLCGTVQTSSARGVIVLGDSVGAHFHFPEVWFNPLLISKNSFLRNFTVPLFDEIDWPQYSFSTGFRNISERNLIQGQVDSVYLRLRKRNLCNHRDYQNVCRNGASSFDLVKFVTNVARSPLDKPAVMIVGAYGNDVCNSFSDTLSNMTTAKQFRENMIQILQYLDKWILPVKSHIILVGLVDGGFIYEALSERLHPIGEYNRDVKYKNIFQWFECMQIGPCTGWMSGNKTIRSATSKHARELSHVLKDLAYTFKPHNVAVHYLPNPLHDVLQNWKKMGRYEFELIEPVDGFHPNQLAQPLITNTLWRYLKQVAPTSIGPVNPHNQEILQRFGDQGGH